MDQHTGVAAQCAVVGFRGVFAHKHTASSSYHESYGAIFLRGVDTSQVFFLGTRNTFAYEDVLLQCPR